MTLAFLSLSSIRRTTIVFAALAASDNLAWPLESSPYTKTGTVECALPGTSISFALNGQGGAIVADFSTNYPPFEAAAKAKVWSAVLAIKDGNKILVLDSLNGTRIMIAVPDGRGIAFVMPAGADEADQGVSDILCQVLVEPD